MTRVQIENALVSWLASAAAATVIVGKPDHSRPNLPYLTMSIGMVKAVGHDEPVRIDEDGKAGTITQTYLGTRTVEASVNGYGAGAFDKLRDVVNSIWKYSVRATLLAAGLAPQPAEEIRDLTTLEPNLEERGQVDFKFGLREEYTDTVGLIEHVEGEGKVVSPIRTYTFAFAADLPAGP